MNNFEIIKFVDNEFEIDVRTDKENDTVWLTQDQIAKLFGKARSTITEHINNIFNDKELDENTSVGFSDESVNHRPSKYYNLDVILSVGYRVNSKRGIAFRKWANKVLKDYLLQGYVINDKRIAALNKTIEIQSKMLSSSLNIDEVNKQYNNYYKTIQIL